MGKWQALEKYPYLTILHKKEVYNASSMGAQNSNFTENYFEVFLLNETHRNRILLSSGKSKEKMMNELENISKYLEKEIVRFNPIKISRK